MLAGAARIINWLCNRQQIPRCWAISTTPASTTTASLQLSFEVARSSWYAPMVRMGHFMITKSNTRSAYIRCSNFSSPCPADACKHSGSRGTAAHPSAGDNGGSLCIPARRSHMRDSRHWTGIDQNWNYMCADCHSTNLHKNYDARTRTFSTSYSEIDVSCEACHGPGSNHVAWAKKEGDWKKFDTTEGLTIALDERKGVAWRIDPATGNARRSSPRPSEREIQVCARCHSRRGEIHEDYVHGQPVGDDYRVALLDQDLYYPDGQIKEEDYEYGSFIQSRMFHAGVTCSDCHEPHSGKIRATGNNICMQCHSGTKVRFAETSFPQNRIGRRAVRRMSHANAHVHGRRSASRSQHPHSAPRPVGEARHSQRVHQLPHGQVGPVGVGFRGQVVRACSPRVSALC